MIYDHLKIYKLLSTRVGRYDAVIVTSPEGINTIEYTVNDIKFYLCNDCVSDVRRFFNTRYVNNWQPISVFDTNFLEDTLDESLM